MFDLGPGNKFDLNFNLMFYELCHGFLGCPKGRNVARESGTTNYYLEYHFTRSLKTLNSSVFMTKFNMMYVLGILS